MHSWYGNEEAVAGEFKSEGNFTFLRVFDSGHMVPADQPEHALEMMT
jgi:cathepsin A (carboxypeptidase C)